MLVAGVLFCILNPFIFDFCRTVVGLRPYYAENTGSHPNPEVKLHQARLVLGWGTTLEPCVLQAFVFWPEALLYLLA